MSRTVGTYVYSFPSGKFTGNMFKSGVMGLSMGRPKSEEWSDELHTAFRNLLVEADDIVRAKRCGPFVAVPSVVEAINDEWVPTANELIGTHGFSCVAYRGRSH